MKVSEIRFLPIFETPFLNQLCIFTVQINAAVLSRNYFKTILKYYRSQFEHCVCYKCINRAVGINIIIIVFSLFYKKNA